MRSSLRLGLVLAVFGAVYRLLYKSVGKLAAQNARRRLP